MRHMSEWYEKQRRRLCVSIVYDRYVRVESFGCDDMHVLSSRYLRRRIECDIMYFMRTRSLRIVRSIVDLRRMFAGQLRIF